MSKELADALFPEISMSIEECIAQYPSRPDWQSVTRFAPSPTWFLHIWWIYTAYIAEKFVHQWGKNWVFVLRIEDTDQKRYVEGAIPLIIQWLKKFWIQFDEGPLGVGWEDVWNYWPYIQSNRKHLYRIFVKHAIERWLAYPCWMNEEEIEWVRNMQQAAKKVPGIYGHYSKWRGASFEQQKEMIDAGTPFVIRLKSPWELWKKIRVVDMIKWDVEIQDNFLDMVLLKSNDGLPTYHMAHLVDDLLLGTTHVIRSDEWFPSLPLHLQLFDVFGFKAPQYAHVSPLLALDAVTGNKRKLSKRHDKEANIAYFFEQWIPTDAILEFLTNIVDPFFEEWQKNNPDKTYKDYEFDISHMNTSWALLDMNKMLFVSKEWLAKLGKEEFYKNALTWAKEYHNGPIQEVEGIDKSTTLPGLMEKYPEYTFDVLNIERQTEADPKRYRMYADIPSQLLPFYDEIRALKHKESLPFPEVCTSEVIVPFLREYSEQLDLTAPKDEWFASLKEIAKKHGFAPTNADFKVGGYIWKAWDVAMYLRVALLCSTTTPDLYESMKVMGIERVKARLSAFVV